MLTSLDKRLGYFCVSRIDSAPSLTIHFNAVPSKWYELLEYEEIFSTIACHDVEQYSFLSYPKKANIFLDARHGEAVGWMKEPCSAWDLTQICRYVLLPSLFNFMGMRNLLAIHASAVSLHGKGVVICGDSGRGKTTLLLHLLREGFDYMADDTVFLMQEHEISRIFALPGYARVTARTANFLPEIDTVIQKTRPDEQGKYQLDVMKSYQCSSSQSAFPTYLLFPQVTGQKHTTLHEIPRKEAALQCISENMFARDTTTSRNYFARLSCFVRSCRCYRVRLGQDMSRVGQHIRRILED